MGITNGFIAVGTQLKIEKPTKGCTVASVDSIEGPIVKLKNGDVRKMESYEESKEAYGEENIYITRSFKELGTLDTPVSSQCTKVNL